MKARATRITLEDVIKQSNILNKKQKDDMLSQHRRFADEQTLKIIGTRMKQCNKEMAAMTLIVLHNYYGFGEKRLEEFAKRFTELYNGVADMLKDTGIMACEGAYSDLKRLYPNCDDWIGGNDDDD